MGVRRNARILRNPLILLTRTIRTRRIPFVKKLDSISFLPLGGGREIGANSYLLGLNGMNVILDCGVHPKKEGVGALPDFSLIRQKPDAVVLSHGHVDHCGALPMLLKRFPETLPYATHATVSIMDCMLHNSVSVMTILAEERGIADYPLYSHEDVSFALQQTRAIELGSEFPLDRNSDVTACFYHAGHVLGSASICLRAHGHTLLYTGDICVSDQELMAGLQPLDAIGGVDTLVIESTYGANVTADNTTYEEQIERFGKAVAVVLERGEVVLVPSFALGRTQEMLNIIARLQDTGCIPTTPVYASGLGRAVYEVYRRYPECLHPNAYLRPLNRFGRVGDVWDRDVVQRLLRDPGIIVATSGMMIENTPSALIAEEMIQHNRHGIFFVGYVDPDTLGYRVLHAKKGIPLVFGTGRPPVHKTLENIAYFHFSAHAPRNALRDLIHRIAPKNVVYVHGDPQAIDWMHEETGTGCRKYSVSAGETITIEA